MSSKSLFRMASAVLLAGALIVPSLSASITSVVKLDQGKIRGRSNGAVMVYKGIPYAAPPVGPLRWRPPQPPMSWSGIRPAQRFSASCIQVVQHSLPYTAEYNIGPPYSEDCLYLNVWTAAKSAGARLPVLFWIHGGGFAVGSGSVPIYNGTNLARKGVVVVTVNYRLGIFGFFADSTLSAESNHHVSGNYGLLDLLAALKWTHRNIAAFGGDPDSITIAGQSAGADAVHLLVASPLAHGLFQRAIAESGSSVDDHSRTLATAERAGDAWAAANGAESAKALRSIPAGKLLTESGDTHLRFGPVVDHWFLPASPATVIAQGKQNDVPTLTGMTADDIGTHWIRGPVTLASYRKQVAARFGPLASKFLALYPAGSDAQAQAAVLQSGRDRVLASMYLWAADRSRTAKTPAYTYYFSRVTPGPIGARFGAFHASDIVFFFDNLQDSPRPWTQLDRHLARDMSNYWVNFMRNGNPNSADLPYWPAFSTSHPQTMEFGVHTGPRRFESAPRLAFFTQYFRIRLSRAPQ